MEHVTCITDSSRLTSYRPITFKIISGLIINGPTVRWRGCRVQNRNADHHGYVTFGLGSGVWSSPVAAHDIGLYILRVVTLVVNERLYDTPMVATIILHTFSPSCDPFVKILQGKVKIPWWQRPDLWTQSLSGRFLTYWNDLG
jgi:hypothetical protein